MLKIVWSKNYLKYDFGPGHPFWPERGVKLIERLRELEIKFEVVEPEKASDEEILLVHTPYYLKQVKRLAETQGFLSMDTPVNPNVLEAAYFSVGGTIKAAKLALGGQRVLNLLGGLHHAKPSTSSGFCIFNDHAIAIRKLQREGEIAKAMIYDLDVHAGNGTQEIFYKDPTVFNISLHQDPATLYPGEGFADEKGEGRGEGFNLNVPLPPGTKGQRYLERLDEVLPLYDEYKPDLVFLILGVDTYKDDPLADLKLDFDDFAKIGQRFAGFKKLVVLCAGGYSREAPLCWLHFLRGFLQA